MAITFSPENLEQFLTDVVCEHARQSCPSATLKRIAAGFQDAANALHVARVEDRAMLAEAARYVRALADRADRVEKAVYASDDPRGTGYVADSWAAAGGEGGTR